jgi:Major capsid protein Gp23
VSRKKGGLKSNVTREMVDDLNAQHGFDIVAKLEKVLVDELTESIDKEIISTIQLIGIFDDIKYSKRYRAIEDYEEFKKGYEYLVKEYEGNYLVQSDLKIHVLTLEELNKHFICLKDQRKQKLDNLK